MDPSTGVELLQLVEIPVIAGRMKRMTFGPPTVIRITAETWDASLHCAVLLLSFGC